MINEIYKKHISPCKQCGEFELLIIETYIESGGAKAAVYCPICDLHGPKSELHDVLSFAKEEAVMNWDEFYP